MSRDQVIELDSESLEELDTLLTLDRDGIENPQHVQCVLENEMMLVCWMNCLDVYSFNENATQGYLGSSEHDIREQQTFEAELLEREITYANEAFETLVALYESTGMDRIFSELQPELQGLGLPSAFTRGEYSVEICTSIEYYVSGM